MRSSERTGSAEGLQSSATDSADEESPARFEPPRADCDSPRRIWRAPRETTCGPSWMVSVREALDPKAHALVPPGLRQGCGLAHGVPAAVELVVAERDAGCG